MKNIGVVGAGTMGAGIAQVAAEAGYNVKIFDVFPGASEKALGKLQKAWQKSVDKEKITPEEMKKRIGLVQVANNIGDFQDCGLVVEAVAESVDVKKSVFSQLDEVCDAKTILASNTSTLSITQIGSFTKRPDKVVGMHFFNPVPVMKLIEIIKSLSASDETIEAVKDVAAKLGKVGVVVNDTPGFIVNRLLVPLCNEAIKMLEAGVASPKDIDTAMKLGANWPMGPFELSDMVGLDVHMGATAGLASELNDSHYAAARLAKQMYRANQLGMKTGKGFYDYKSR